MGSDRPHISVVTATRNAAQTLEDCLVSVAIQTGVTCEHIIVDGGSTDRTLDILCSWDRYPLRWSSRSDAGISDAFNRGIGEARGELIAILNADDRLTAGALARAVAALDAHPQAGFCFGHCLHLEQDGRTWLNRADPRYAERMRYFMPDVNHPTMIIRRSTYDLVGLYDLRWRYAMDYDWLLRAHTLGVRGTLVPAIQAEMRMGGISDRAWRRAYAEARLIAIRHGAPASIAWIDHLARIAKGSIRRTLAACGAKGLEATLRHWRQRRRLGVDDGANQVLPPT